MKKNIILALSVLALFIFIPFQISAEQKLVSNKVIAIDQPAFQISKDKKLLLIDKWDRKKFVTKDGVYEPIRGVRIWVKNGKVIRTSGLQTGKQGRLSTTGRPGHSAVILSKISLSNWNQNRTKFIGLTGQIKISPQSRKVINNVTRRLNEIDSVMQRVAKLQRNPQKNKSALISASLELQRYEKIIKKLQQELLSQYQKMEEELQATGDDAQLANIDLQNMLQKQQQTIQMMSQIAKVLHDTALAVIRKIG